MRIASASTDTVSIEKIFIGKQPENALLYVDSAVMSPDLRHYAYVAVSDDGMQVCVNKNYGKKYHHIARGYPIFSPVENRIGYIADKENDFLVVIDDKEYPGYNGACCLKFSPNGKYFAYIAQDKNKQFVALNGYSMQPYDMIDIISGVLFSPDSRTAAYVAKNNSENSVRLVVNGKGSPPFDSITEIVFSPDSRTIAYIASKDKNYFVVRGEVKQGPYDKAEGLTWSSDSVRLAYIAIKDAQFLVIDNDLKTPAGDFEVQTAFFDVPTDFDLINLGNFSVKFPQVTPPSFSPDASRLAFVKLEKKKYRFVIDKTTGPPFDAISQIVFSPDSKHYAYIGVIMAPLGGKKMQIVHDQTRSPFYDDIDKPFFSPDSTHLAYRVNDNNKQFMIVDGKAQKTYDRIGKPYFSPDSSTLAYQAAKKEGSVIKVVMVVNEKEESYRVNNLDAPLSDIITPPVFSPDSRHLAYLLQSKGPQPQCMLVINGVVIQTFNAHFVTTVDAPIVFDSENSAHFLAGFLKDDRFEIFQINITIGGQR